MGRRKKRKKWFNDQTHNTQWFQERRNFYRVDEHLGTENRTTEFKSGPEFISYGFRNNVSKYVCGFVNSQENGKLLLGVNDDGKVVGYSCDQRQEDILRRDIDEAIKDIVPPIFPKDYRVGFVPVCNDLNGIIDNFKVIEIMVQGSTIEVKDQLYSNKQGVFMRRDGSIQLLKANEIQEWVRRHFQGEMLKLKKNEDNLKEELHAKQSELRQKDEKLQEKDNLLQEKINQLKAIELTPGRQKSEDNHLTDETKELQDGINHMKQSNTGSAEGAQGTSSEVLEKLQEMKLMLKEHDAHKKSKVCSIS